MMNHEVMSKSPVSEKYKDVLGKYGCNVMQCAVVDAAFVKGGCFRCNSDKKLKGSYNTYEVFNLL